MSKLAKEKITVSLTNMRTRKWRPAIETAFDEKRPTSLLLQDAICIFEGKELCAIDDWDGQALFASDPHYSLPLKELKKIKKDKPNKASSKQANSGDGKTKKATSSKTKRKKASSTNNTPRKNSKIANDAKSDSDVQSFVENTINGDRSPHAGTLSNAEGPPAFDLSPITGEINSLMAAAGIWTDVAAHEAYEAYEQI